MGKREGPGLLASTGYLLYLPPINFFRTERSSHRVMLNEDSETLPLLGTGPPQSRYRPCLWLRFLGHHSGRGPA